jgi:hypothetical protein
MSEKTLRYNKSLDILDESQLDNLIEILQSAKAQGYSVGHTISAVRTLLEVMVDSSMLVGRALASEDSQYSRPLNQDLKFLENAKMNPNKDNTMVPTIKVGPSRENTIVDHQASRFFLDHLPPFLIQLKRGKTFQEAFLELLSGLRALQPAGVGFVPPNQEKQEGVAGGVSVEISRKDQPEDKARKLDAKFFYDRRQSSKRRKLS